MNDSTGGRGADFILDPVGGDVLERSLDCIANEGRIVIIGYASGKWFDAPSIKLVLKNISVVGMFMGAYNRTQLNPVFENLLELFSKKQIRATIERVIPFEQIPRALTDIANHSAVGRIGSITHLLTV